jgi:hypothetical protein
MRRRLIEELKEVIAAEQLAAELRQTHGRAAEEVCDALMARRRPGDPELERLKDVRRALRWV